MIRNPMFVGVVYNAFEPVAGREQESLSEIAVETAAAQAAEALRVCGARVEMVPVKQSIESVMAWVRTNEPDALINLCEGFRGLPAMEAQVAAVFELMGVPFTGNTSLALGQCQDKFRTKAILQAWGIPVPRGWLVESEHELPADLPFPLIVKPNAEDASIGITADAVVHDRLALAERVAFVVSHYAQHALVEEFVDGREFNVAVIQDPDPRALPVSEIQFHGFPKGMPRIVGYEAKWREDHAAYRGTVPVCPAPIPEPLAAELQRIALRVFRLLRLRGYARVDFRVDAKQRVHVLEANPNPDTSRDAGLARGLAAAGLVYHDFWMSQVRLAVSAGRVNQQGAA